MSTGTPCRPASRAGQPTVSRPHTQHTAPRGASAEQWRWSNAGRTSTPVGIPVSPVPLRHSPLVQTRQSRRQRATGPGEGACLRAAQPEAAQDTDSAVRAPTPRPMDAAPPPRVDGTTQTDVPSAPQPAWPSTPSPPPPRHPPPVFFPSQDSSSPANSQGQLPAEAGHQEPEVVDHQHGQNQGDTGEEHHQYTRRHQEANPGDCELHQTHGVELRHQEVQCGGDSTQTCNGDRDPSEGSSPLNRGGLRAGRSHTDADTGDTQPHETRPPEPRPREPRPGDRARPRLPSGGRERLAPHPGDIQA
ncbi:lysine-rich arabinogalactan protein 19-like [Portunus trituberculatus]|uniref:lysine-rich arabinogalactan protein 19-like n=1 Tax=Portunus trituberculatus TaxID=210409 RepID=UPI001E1CCA7D|nr:lysine-rich arabinogalactan protein 19-like [Portunus trituberculatus]